MNQAVPEDIDEPNKFTVVTRDDHPRLCRWTCSTQSTRPIENARLERYCVEFVQFNVVEVAAPLVRDRHQVSLVPSPATSRSADNAPCASSLTPGHLRCPRGLRVTVLC
jgi:hypothetical protein